MPHDRVACLEMLTATSVALALHGAGTVYHGWHVPSAGIDVSLARLSGPDRTSKLIAPLGHAPIIIRLSVRAILANQSSNSMIYAPIGPLQQIYASRYA